MNQDLTEALTMKIFICIQALTAIIGLFLWGFASGKLMEVGKIMFWVGLLSFLLNETGFLKLVA